MTITQTITNFPAAPDSATDTPSVFNTKANAFVGHQSGVYVGEVNTWATQANAVRDDINSIVATLPAGVIDDTTPSSTNTYSSTKIDAEIAAGGSVPPTDPAWDGTTIADEAALRNYYGDQSITVAGGSFTAKSYPDGSVVGSTDNGDFAMSANGNLESRGTSASVMGPTPITFPIVFIDATYSIQGTRAGGGTISQFAAFGAREVSYVNAIMYNTDGTAVAIGASWEARGRWK